MTNTFTSFQNTRITGGMWKHRQDINAATTVQAVYDRFAETGRVGALDFTYNNGAGVKPHIFWDSDIAKWLEAASYVIRQNGSEHLQALADAIVDKIATRQRPDGYYNMYFQQVEPDQIFQRRTDHELYCAGHLIEAAVAYYQATGKNKLLRIMRRYADHIERVFMYERTAAFTTPGHEEIELALVRLWETTGEDRYLALARFFIDQRGLADEMEYTGNNHSYSQSHLPVREQTTAVGHAVRACYLYMAMADMARIDGDAALKSACEALFDNMVSRRMYITGGVGSSAVGEAFTIDYDLPNMTAYSESCAAIALMLFSHRMIMMDADSRYGDTMERILYNNFLSAVSLDGESFFYENPLEIIPRLSDRDASVIRGKRALPITQRRKSFDCSCCPPNVARVMPVLGRLIYSRDDDTLYIHHYMDSEAEEGSTRIRQTTDYPTSGRIDLIISGNTSRRIAFRKPHWCDGIALTVNGNHTAYSEEMGYLYIDASSDMSITIEFGMQVQTITANPLVVDNCGKVAITRGPIVYCAESIDNGENLSAIAISEQLNASVEYDAQYHCPILYVDAWRTLPFAELYTSRRVERQKIRMRMIPYFAFANRGESEMAVWFNHGRHSE
ncbi:hypothetical protein AGMMS49992_19160 [Clostridia bacterium]|nr:hypothetical protein AGMMS49992_19160 [Clostridia bacterium]